jgi:ABC-2 type transport system permease protein
MNELAGLVAVQGRRAFNTLLRGGPGLWFKAVLGLLAGLLFLGGLYALFVQALKYFYSVQLVGVPITEKLLSLVFLTFFGMVLFSNVVATISTTYLSDDLKLLNSLPLRRGSVVAYKFLETWFDSSWMPLLLFLPVFAAYAHQVQAGWTFYPVAFVVLAIFLVVPSALGFLATALLMRLFPARRTRDLFILVGVLALVGVMVMVRLANPEDIVRDPDQLKDWVEYLQKLRTPAAPWLPSAWASQAVLGALYGSGDLFLGGAWPLGLTAALLLAAVLGGGRLVFFTGWCHAQESQESPAAVPTGRRASRGDWSLGRRLLPPPLRAMLVKDVKTFLRDSTQWAQLLLLLSLILVYLYNYRRIPLNAYREVRNMIFFLSIGFSGFIVSAVATRYVFPAVSLEGRAFWWVRSSPLPLRQFLWGKFAVAFVPLLLLSETVMGLSVWVMKTDAFMATLAFSTMALLTLGLTTLGVGLGSVFTYFTADNAAKVSTSLGGYVYMMGSVALIALTLLVEVTPVRLYYLTQGNFLTQRPWEWGVPLLVLAALYSTVTVVPLRWGAERLRRMEI